MKYYRLLLVVLILLVSCIKEEVGEESVCIDNETTNITLMASLEGNTKTALEQGGKVHWCSGDVIRYKDGNPTWNLSSGYQTLAIENDCDVAPMSFTISQAASSLTALYCKPINVTTHLYYSYLVVDLPTYQTGRFEDAHISVAYTNDLTDGAPLVFRNVTSLIKFTLNRDDVGYVEFKGNYNEEVSGWIDIYPNYNVVKSSFNEGEERIIVETQGAGTYYISTLPTTFAYGFTIQCYDTEGFFVGQAKSKKSMTLARSEIKNLGVLDERLTKDYSDVSAKETANCYLISVPGDYKFNCMVQGNSNDPVAGVPATAEVLWESLGTTDAPQIGDVVNDVKLQDGYVCFTARKDGNALIAVKDAAGDILWSWHIWVCRSYVPAYKDQVYPYNAGTMMDRNLGATSIERGDSRSYGLLYQWGRKDPFFPEANYNYTYKNKTTNWSSWKSCTSDANKGTIDFSIKSPMTFIKDNSLNHDWLYTGDNTNDASRWNSAKTKYDPCPPGYRVPDGGFYGIWAEAFGGYSEHPSYMLTWDDDRKGIDFSSVLGDGVWYPSTYSDGACAGNYLSCHNNWNTTEDWSFSDSGAVSSCVTGISYGYRSSLRCQKVDAVTDLSSSGSANCYIIDKKGRYKIKAVKGNSNVSVGNVSFVSLLWDDYIEKEGLDHAGNIGIVSNYGYRDGYIYFQTFGKDGNALISANDDKGNVLWSWHLWCTGNAPTLQFYNNNAGTMMDRNLGALSATKGDVRALGLIYQWGRKDPFLNSVYIDGGMKSGLQYLFTIEDVDATTGTIDYAIAHPKAFLKGSGDWLYNTNTSGSSTRWAEQKTIYDPCPPGYRVPSGGENGVWAIAANTNNNPLDANDPPFDKNNYGMNFTKFYSPGAWYPAAGYYDYKDGDLINVGLAGLYGSTNSYALYFYNPYNDTYRSAAKGYGVSIRCQKE